MSTSLFLYRISSAEAFDWAIPLDSVTFCYFFSQPDINSVAALHSQGAIQLATHHPTPFLISIYVGPQLETGFEWVEEQGLSEAVFWIGPEGLESEVSKKLGVEETPLLIVTMGDQVKQRFKELPEDLRPLIPCEILPMNATEMLTYESLAEYLKGEDITDITAAYRDIARVNPQMGLREISTLIAILSDLYQLDLSESSPWFASPRYGDDEDLIDPSNITEDMFVQRLKKFCLSKANAGLNLIQSAELLEGNPGNYEELKALLDMFGDLVGKTGEASVKIRESEKSDLKDTEIMDLTVRISEKEHIIEQLKRELAARNTEITAIHAEIQESLASIVAAPTPQSSNSTPAAQSPPTVHPIKSQEVAKPKDEVDFWKFGQEEEPNPPVIPRFDEIAAAKGLWILTAEAQGIGPSIKDWRGQQVKGRKRTLPPLQNDPVGPRRRTASRVTVKKKSMEKVQAVAGKN